ncbi:MAG TPA: anti-sigma factor [Pyrinomonadaceae bacterium]|jgi:hypothetical protein
MGKRLVSILGGVILSLAMASLALAQNTTTTTTTTTDPAKGTVTQTTQNADGSWTVVEYPIDKEVMVDLRPSVSTITTVPKARILRSANGTLITIDPSNLRDVNGNLYAVDPLGHVTLLGPLTATGTNPLTFNTPLDKFMLVVSPEGNLTTYAPNTNFVYRSAVPQGFAVVPYASHGERDGAAVGERVSATSTPGATSGYSVPMLGIPGFRRGTDTQMKINFTGALTGSRANVFIEPRKDGPTTIKMRFHELKEAPAGSVYAVWAVSPDNKFVKLGQIVNTGQRNEAQIQTETALQDFGLFITLEEEPHMPTGTIVGTIIR